MVWRRNSVHWQNYHTQLLSVCTRSSEVGAAVGALLLVDQGNRCYSNCHHCGILLVDY